MAYYGFINPVLPGKIDAWESYVKEMTGPRSAEYKASRRKAGLNVERVWLQHTPVGDYAVVYWEAADIGKVFQQFMTSDEPIDKWFRDRVLVEIHGMDISNPPPTNDIVLDFKA